MKRVVSILLITVLCIGALIACGKKTGDEEAKTVANIVKAEFDNEIKSNASIEDVANKLIENPVFQDMAMGVMPVEEGFLNGFNGEILGFNSGVMFAPMIGTIPFVGYIFETDTPEELAKTLEESHQLNWNICTTADEMIVKTEGNYVFFVMAPSSFEE